MSTLIFKLRNVPDDEAAEVRALLADNKLEYYETTAGNWGIGMPGIWVEDEAAAHARQLINDYQHSRSLQQREHYAQAAAKGENTAWYAQWLERPFATLGIVLFCMFIVYALLSPFVRLATAN